MSLEIEHTTIDTDLTQQEFRSMETNLPKDVIILDVHIISEVAEGMVEGAFHLDYRKDTFRDKVAKPYSSKTYVVYC